MTARVCARDGCGKPLITAPPKTMPKALRPMFMEALVDDEFCSMRCCRESHGVMEDPNVPAMSTTPRNSTAGPPTRLQRARLELSDAARKAGAERRPDGLCDLCGVQIPLLDAGGREGSSLRRFCSHEHQRRYNARHQRVMA